MKISAFKLTHRTLLTSTALLAAIPVAAGAQQTSSAIVAAPATQTTNTGTKVVDATDSPFAEIVVTAQRRSGLLMKTPVAIQAISADALVEQQIRTQEDLRSIAPGLSIRAGVDTNELNFALRGQSKDPLTDTTPGVLPYFNEVPVGGGKVGAVSFYDLQSIQVLKGPQGTLFGRSSTGGALLATTTKPEADYHGYVGVSLGDYDLRSVEAAMNVPILDNGGDNQLLFRIAGLYRERNGFQHNIFPNGEQRIGDNSHSAVRPSLLLNVGDFHNELVFDYLYNEGSGMNSVVAGLLPFTGNGPPFVPATFLYGGTAPGARAVALGTLAAFLPGVPAATIAGYYDAYFAPGSGHPAGGLNQVLADQQARGPFTVDLDGRPSYHGNNQVVTNSSTYDLGPDTTIKNIFGFVRTSWYASYDSDGTPFGLGNDFLANPIFGTFYNGGNTEVYRQFSEELQLQGKILDDRLSYTTGFYFSDEHRFFTNHQPFFDILLGGSAQTNLYYLDDQSEGVYAQGTYQINDSGLSSTAGLRYTIDDPSKTTLPGDSFRNFSAVAPAGYSFNQSATYYALDYQFGLQDQIDPGLLLYGVTRRAYKPGGFNGTVAPKNGTASVSGDSFVAEKVSDFEIGAKLQRRLLGMPTRLTVAAYYDWTENDQRLAFTLASGNPASLTVNVPEGENQGFEIEGQISPVGWLSIGGTVNYLHSSYSSTPVFVNGQSQLYDQVPDAPRISGTVYADVTLPITEDYVLLLHGDAFHQSKSFDVARSADNDGATMSGYTLANFRVALEDDARGLSLDFNIKNAFDKVYYTGGLATGEIFQINVLVPGEPRTFSVDARYKF